MPFDIGVASPACSGLRPFGTWWRTALSGRYKYWLNPPHNDGGVSIEV